MTPERLTETMEWKYLYWVWLAALSAITFIVYGFDKSRARNSGRRVPEKVLHWLALAGGFPGGWAGRAVFRHKTQKAFFTFVLGISTLIHLGFIYLLFFI